MNVLAAFENDLIGLVNNIKFWAVHSHLQRSLKLDIKLILQSGKTLTPADKTSNMCRLTKEEYNKMCRDAITSTYKNNGNIKKGMNKKKKKKSLKSYLVTLLIGWT